MISSNCPIEQKSSSNAAIRRAVVSGKPGSCMSSSEIIDWPLLSTSLLLQGILEHDI
jgi:hypothetical protein